MNKEYIKLFKELTRATAAISEQVMDYNREQKDDKGLQTADTLRKDFENLYDKIAAENFDGNLTKAEYAKLLVGSYVIVGNLQDRIDNLKKGLAGYQSDLIPKLSKIINESDDSAAQKLAEELFTVQRTNI